MKPTLKRLRIVVIVIIVAVTGTYLLVASHAATPYTSTTAANGTLAGQAQVVQNCGGASNGSCVAFGMLTACSSGCSVVGNAIENANGQQVLLHGANRPSLESSCTGTTVTGQATGIPASDFAAMQDAWNATSIRLPLDQDYWLSGAGQYCGPNSQTGYPGYQATVQTAVQNAEANHMVAILDLHWSDQGNLKDQTGPEQQCMPDQNSVTFWQQVAKQYKNDPNVWFELYNEPGPPGVTTLDQWNTWQNGGQVTCNGYYTNSPSVTFTAAGMQQLVDTVRGTGARNIILAGALTSSKGASLNGVPLLTGTNIAYTIHPYDNDDLLTNQQAEWATNFGNISSQVPVVATEFGDFECGNTPNAVGYEKDILSYFRVHNISYMPWAWYLWSKPCSPPSVITDAAGDCLQSMGCLIQQDMKSYPAY